jgi:hypothetical protein
MTIKANGNVGIGTNTQATNPAHKLVVSGTAHFCKAIVKYDGWCDYVFENEYELMPLNKLKEYIKVEKHLPEIPTTKEIEQTDVDLGEMNKLLLKKVEELTLYLIQQQEQLDLQNTEIQKLKNK